MRFTYQQLRVFEAVARRLSFTRAAEELGLTQPTVSLQVKQLADDIGMALFEQVGRRVMLTEAGRELQGTVVTMFDSWSRFEQRIDEMRGLKRGTLRLAVVTTAKYFIPDMLGPFCRQYPDIDIRLEIANRETLIERLTDNSDHLYIMALPPEMAGLTRIPFRENALVVIGPRDHPLTTQGKVPLRRLADERFIVREPGSGTRLKTDAVFSERGFTPDVRMELGSNEAIKHAVAAGLGVAVISTACLDVDPMIDRLAILDVDGFPVADRWYVVHHANRRLSVVAATFMAFLGITSPLPGVRAATDVPPLRRVRLDERDRVS